MTRRLKIVAVAGLCAFLGLQLAAGFAMGRADHFAALGVAWLGLGLALMLEPSASTSSSLARTLLASGGAALGAALVTFAAMQSFTPEWSDADDELGTLLMHTWSVGDAVRVVVVLMLSALPAPMTLLLVRRVDRQLEWQAAAAALGPLLVGVTLFPGELDKWGVLLLVLSGLPTGFGAYLLDRRLLGPAAIACFPAPVPAPVVAPDGTVTPREPERHAPAVPARWIVGALVLGLVWAFVVTRVGRALAPSAAHPGMPDLTALFAEVSAAQEQHRQRTGTYARTLGALESLPLDVRGGATRGYALRYARLGESRWVLTGDPVPAHPGWSSLRFVGPDGEVERSLRPLNLRVETR